MRDTTLLEVMAEVGALARHHADVYDKTGEVEALRCLRDHANAARGKAAHDRREHLMQAAAWAILALHAHDAVSVEAPRGVVPKPPRVEVGQRWRFDARDIDGVLMDYAVEAATESEVRLVGERGRVRYAKPAEMLTSLRWSFLGSAPAPQGPGPQREPSEADADAPAADVPSEPTARDAVVGRLLRSGFGSCARDLVDGARIESIVDELRSYPGNSAAVACIAALEALDRGDLRGPRDVANLRASLDNALSIAESLSGIVPGLTRERDEARAEAAALRAEKVAAQEDGAAALERLRRLAEPREDRVDAAPTPEAPPLRPAEDVAREMVSGSRCQSRWNAYECARAVGHSGMHETCGGVTRWPDSADTRETIEVCEGSADGQHEECAAPALPAQQPRDLAGRIRGLIQEYAGRWADGARLPESRHLRVEACMHAMRWLWHTLRRLETDGTFPEDRITELRKYSSDDIVAKTMRGLADELEAIVRECGEGR